MKLSNNSNCKIRNNQKIKEKEMIVKMNLKMLMMRMVKMMIERRKR